MQLTINSDTSLQEALGIIRDEYHTSRYLKVSIRTGKDRSIDQNSISHAWYEQLARELKEDDALGWKGFSKLHFGVPILRSEDYDFRLVYDDAIKPLTYEQKLKVMAYMPVTSLMTKKQLTKYLEAMQEHFKTRSVFLEFPESEA